MIRIIDEQYTGTATYWSFCISSNKDVDIRPKAAVSFCSRIILMWLGNGVNRVAVWRWRRKPEDSAAVGSNSSEARRGERRSPFIIPSTDILLSCSDIGRIKIRWLLPTEGSYQCQRGSGRLMPRRFRRDAQRLLGRHRQNQTVVQSENLLVSRV